MLTRNCTDDTRVGGEYEADSYTRSDGGPDNPPSHRPETKRVRMKQRGTLG